MSVSRATLPRPGATIGYRREGTGPPLLLLHATLSSAARSAPLAILLGSHATVVSVDRRGSGTSPLDPGHVDGPIDVAVHVGDLVALITAERLGPCLLVGHSYGACVALELAARRPQLVRGVFAWEPPYAPLASSDEQARLARLATETLAAARDDGLRAAAAVFLAGVSGPEAATALSTFSSERGASLGPAAVAEASLLGLRPDGLASIACAVTIATGGRSEPLYASIAGALVDRIPGARRIELPCLDHMAPIHEPDIIATAVEEHLLR